MKMDNVLWFISGIVIGPTVWLLVRTISKIIENAVITYVKEQR